MTAVRPLRWPDSSEAFVVRHMQHDSSEAFAVA